MLNNIRLRSVYTNEVLIIYFDDLFFRFNIDVAEIGFNLKLNKKNIA